MSPHSIRLIFPQRDLYDSICAGLVSPNAHMRSTQAATSAMEAREVSKKRLRSARDTFALPSAVLTLAEGNGERSSRLERRRFFEMSMGSIAEVAACLDLARAFGLMNRVDQESFKSRLRKAYVMINALP